MKKHILYTCLALGIASCNDFLTDNPTGQLTTSSSVSSPEIARAFVDGAYSQIVTFNNGGGGWGGTGRDDDQCGRIRESRLGRAVLRALL
ncbi:hypothetical protein [Dyadobacter sp. 676]|uniref:RagB/SusD family nutrient uptake outer membrane protein n=1 Tax=Dyadobacter sp. 676 TaxID=3088362 RepID=A0AAU8FSH9_9BACT